MKHWNEQTAEIAQVINEASKREGIQWTRVTWYSWWLAIIFFALVLPALSFYIGTQYQLTKDVVGNSGGWERGVVISPPLVSSLPEDGIQSPVSPVSPAIPIGGGRDGEDAIACTMDARACPDGSYVGRVGPHCEFAPCPSGDAPSTGQELIVPM